jgi:ribosome-associated toxin RatA of RatAB toxin-antitoxin module
MAKLETEHVFNGKVEAVFAALGKYELYPKYLPGVQAVEVLPASAEGSSAQVRYDLKIIKEFFYTLDMFETSPSEIRWELNESNIMKLNTGSWKLSPSGKGKTRAVYSLEIKFRGLIPSAITDKVAQANLPSMFAGFQKLIDEN